MSVERVERIYNTYSSVYDHVFGRLIAGDHEIAPRLLDLSPGAQLLEVGVGTGLSLPVLPRNIEFTGIDLSEKMLARARKRVKDIGFRNTRLLKMDAHQLEFADNSFDRVLAAYFISTVPEPIRVVEEIKRVCRPGGYIVFLNHFVFEQPLVAALERAFSPVFYRVGFNTNLDLNEFMKDAGLEVEALENIGDLGVWKAVRCVNPSD